MKISLGFTMYLTCAETIVLAIKDVLIKVQLSLVNFRRQCYDGASNIMGHKTDVAKRI